MRAIRESLRETTGDESDANRHGSSGGGGTLKGFLGRGMSSSPLDLFKTDIAYFATLLK